jgi:hypothetical protein
MKERVKWKACSTSLPQEFPEYCIVAVTLELRLHARPRILF